MISGVPTSTSQLRMFLFILGMFLMIKIVAIRIAGILLMERKTIGISRHRSSLNKTYFLGIMTPVLDAFKLVTKRSTCNYKIGGIMFLAGPSFLFIIMFLLIVFSEMFYVLFNFKFYFFFVLLLFGMNVYSTMFCG